MTSDIEDWWRALRRAEWHGGALFRKSEASYVLIRFFQKRTPLPPLEAYRRLEQKCREYSITFDQYILQDTAFALDFFEQASRSDNEKVYQSYEAMIFGNSDNEAIEKFRRRVLDRELLLPLNDKDFRILRHLLVARNKREQTAVTHGIDHAEMPLHQHGREYRDLQARLFQKYFELPQEEASSTELGRAEVAWKRKYGEGRLGVGARQIGSGVSIEWKRL